MRTVKVLADRKVYDLDELNEQAREFAIENHQIDLEKVFIDECIPRYDKAIEIFCKVFCVKLLGYDEIFNGINFDFEITDKNVLEQDTPTKLLSYVIFKYDSNWREKLQNENVLEYFHEICGFIKPMNDFLSGEKAYSEYYDIINDCFDNFFNGMYKEGQEMTSYESVIKDINKMHLEFFDDGTIASEIFEK